eukprot:6020661-Pyramimonas_sp.AAC.1
MIVSKALPSWLNSISWASRAINLHFDSAVVGLRSGKLIGARVDELVGAIVGELVGAGVGDLVGAGVGERVSAGAADDNIKSCASV